MDHALVHISVQCMTMIFLSLLCIPSEFAHSPPSENALLSAYPAKHMLNIGGCEPEEGFLSLCQF